MTTTAHEDQFTAALEPVRQPYDTASILRRNVAELEVALNQQTERAEKAETELAKLAQQKPVATLALSYYGSDFEMFYDIKDLKFDNGWMRLYASPVPAPAVPATCSDGSQAELRKMLQWMIGQRGKSGHNHKRPGVWDVDNGAKAGTPCETCAMYDKAHALLQSADHSEQAIEKVAPDCRACANRGRVNWPSQESYCDSCIYQGRDWRKNHFVDVAADRLLEGGE